jgi:hypothetical protein
MNRCGCNFWRSVLGARLADYTLPQLLIELHRLNYHRDRFQRIEHQIAAGRKEEKKP